MKEYNTYTGTLEYKGVQFTFVFDKKILKLNPPEEKKDEVRNWFLKEITPGTYTLGDPIYIKEIIYGKCNETGQKIIFIPANNDIGRISSTLIVYIDYYIINKYNRTKIDRIAIQGPEINCIFPTSLALRNINWKENGELDISTKSFTETTSEKEIFKIDENELSVYFGISISSSYKNGESPLTLSSTMFIEFNPTEDYKFIIKVLEISKQLIQYIFYRINIIFYKVEL